MWDSGQQLSGELNAEGETVEEQLQRALARIVQLEDQNVALWEVGSFSTDVACDPRTDSRQGLASFRQRGAEHCTPNLALILLHVVYQEPARLCVSLITGQFLLFSSAVLIMEDAAEA